jgi:hypothetical protein
MINVLSEDKVNKHAMQTHLMPPMRIYEPLNPRGTVADRKVVGKVGIPSEGWESQRSAEFVVAPLKEHDAILGMPFLVDEGVLIDPARGRVVLPMQEGGVGIELDESDKSRPESESTQLRDYLAKFDGVPPSDPALQNEYFGKLNEYFVKRYKDVFAENLPDRPPHPDSPRHRIILQDENLSLNGRNYRIPTRYWSELKEFIEIHLKAYRIRPSSSHIASGTIMVPKESDPEGMPRVIHDYRVLNAETIKDHTPLMRQEDILECMAKAAVRGKIDLVCAYYQILMEIADIHKTAFKTPFGMYEWLVMPQGLCNAVATFQRYMNWVLQNYIGKFCAVYIDDIAIWSDSVEEHAEHVRLVLEVEGGGDLCQRQEVGDFCGRNPLPRAYCLLPRGGASGDKS